MKRIYEIPEGGRRTDCAKEVLQDLLKDAPQQWEGRLRDIIREIEDFQDFMEIDNKKRGW